MRPVAADDVACSSTACWTRPQALRRPSDRRSSPRSSARTRSSTGPPRGIGASRWSPEDGRDHDHCAEPGVPQRPGDELRVDRPQGARRGGRDASAAPVGTGPFYLESYTRGEKALLQRNTRTGARAIRGSTPSSTGWASTPTPSSSRSRRASSTSWATNIPSGAYTAISGDPAYKDQFVRESLVATNFLVIDTSRPDGPLSNVRCARRSRRRSTRTTCSAQQRSVPKAGCIYPPQMTSFDAACDPYPRDVEGAQALMAEAGFRDGF